MSTPPYHIFTARFEELQTRIARWVPENELEEIQVAKWKDPSRRESWIAGRILIKRSIRALWKSVFSRIQIHPPHSHELQIISRNDKDKGIRPEVHFNGQPLPAAFSLSHSETKVMLGVTSGAGWSIGIDLARMEDIDPIRLSWCWSSLERQMIKQSPHERLQAASLWALKEACYKAMNHFQEGFNPQQVLIGVSDAGNYQLKYFGVSPGENQHLQLDQNEEEVLGIALIQPTAEALNHIQEMVAKPTM